MRKKKNLINDIIVIDNETDLVDSFDKIDLRKDIIFCLPENAKEKLSVSFSGSIKVTMGEQFNLSAVPNRFDGSSPFRIWKVTSKLKFCTPRGVVPIFMKPSNNRSVASTNVFYEEYLDVKILKGSFSDKEIHSQDSVIYQNLIVETTTNKVLLGEEIPTLIMPGTTVLFELLPIKTYLSETDYCGKLFLIRNNEFYGRFKESV
jgi:hypothetical protein